jgi:uncharacterized repeat protein (TIGR03803 family)
MCKLNWSIKACSIFLLWAATAVALPAQTFTALHSFEGTDGSLPVGELVQATNGKFYGTTEGGANDYGTVFTLTPSRVLTKLFTFDQTDGAYPRS